MKKMLIFAIIVFCAAAVVFGAVKLASSWDSKSADFVLSIFRKPSNKEVDLHYSEYMQYACAGDIQGTEWEAVHAKNFYTYELFREEYEHFTGKNLPTEFTDGDPTYIVCYGYTLERLYYNENEISGRYQSDDPYYYAKAVLKKASPNVVYVYRVEEKIRIDRDTHEHHEKYTTVVE